MEIYNDTHLLALMCVCEHFSVNYCFQEPFPRERPHLGLILHSERDPWLAYWTGNVASVMRMPNVPRAAMRQKQHWQIKTLLCWAQRHGNFWRGNLCLTQLVAGAWVQCRRSLQRGAEAVPRPVPVLLSIFSWAKLVAEMVTIGQ